MKITWWVAALVGLVIGAILWPTNSQAEDYSKLFKQRREARKGMTFKDHMDKYNVEVKRFNNRPIDHMGTLAPKRSLKTPQNRGKKCGSRNRYAR